MTRVPTHRKSGFTLVEMLTVIAIIVLLAGMLLPAVAEAQRRIHSHATRGQIRAIETAVEQYRQDFRDYPMSGNPAAPFTQMVNGQAPDGAAALFRSIAQTFVIAGVSYGPYYARSDDEISASMNIAWLSAGGTPYLVDKIPPGMPILYYRANKGRNNIEHVICWEHCENTRVRPGTGLNAHMTPTSGPPPNDAPGSPWRQRVNFYMGRATMSPDMTPWGEYPRWGCYGPDNRPSRETFMLVSPGLDRKYGTRDDVRNYETN